MIIGIGVLVLKVYDAVTTAIDIYNDPTDPMSYVGLLPMPGSKWFKRIIDKLGDVTHHITRNDKLYKEGVERVRGTYPSKTGKFQKHHDDPIYLGGDKSGPTTVIDAEYHQVITNEFRKEWGYGQGMPTPEQVAEIMEKVYKKYPLPKK